MRHIVVTTDPGVTDAQAHYARLALDEWRANPGPVLWLGPGFHVATELPDGTWVRVCHDEASVPEATEAV